MNFLSESACEMADSKQVFCSIMIGYMQNQVAALSERVQLHTLCAT